MNELTQDELKATIEDGRGWCVSLFMPTHRNGLDNQEDRIRYKNLLREAEQRLAAAGLRAPEARRLLEPALDHADDGLFWEHQLGGLAVFISEGSFRHFLLPVALEELVVVNDRFHIKPLFPLLYGDSEFYILALSKNMVKLFKASRFHIEEDEIPGAPKNMREALVHDDYDVNYRFQQGGAVPPPTSKGGRAAQYYSQGVGNEEVKDQLLRYFHRIDEALHERISSDDDPLVVAAVDYLLPIYREANTYPYLADEAVPGNPELADPDELRERAWEIVAPRFDADRREAADRYNDLSATNKASSRVEEVVLAALEGRVETLFVPTDVEVWGSVDREQRRVELHQVRQPVDQDLLDLAATETILHSGSVYGSKAVEVPGGGVIAAIYRYAV
ncbi:MAG: hypothetical protein C4521_10160 [Actinobacteria bacterium]|nr:MAG: hypothetical protein C4521_10160 [Actinomycetota bacterium]